jgi:hypothetical protein
MKKNLTTPVLRFLGLLAVLPLLVAHGLGGNTCVRDCELPDPFIMSGSADPTSPIKMGSSLRISFLNTYFRAPSESAGSNLAPVDIAPISSPSHDDTVGVSVNTGSAQSEYADIWFHNTHGGKVKLLQKAESPSFIIMDFSVNAYGGLDADQTSSMASSSDYMLAGGSAGMGDIEFDASFEVFINGQSIYSKNANASNAITAPITFQAETGDRLRIVASVEDEQQHKVAPLWLFTPDGNGIKLFHGGLIKRIFDTSADMDVQYALP